MPSNPRRGGKRAATPASPQDPRRRFIIAGPTLSGFTLRILRRWRIVTMAAAAKTIEQEDVFICSEPEWKRMNAEIRRMVGNRTIVLADGSPQGYGWWAWIPRSERSVVETIALRYNYQLTAQDLARVPDIEDTIPDQATLDILPAPAPQQAEKDEVELRLAA